MKRRDLLKTAGAAVFTGAQGSAAPAKRPNIVFLISDQHRYDCVGANGNPAIHTPHLDRIAREGVRFERAYSSTPTCTPARSALLTGQSPWKHGNLGLGRVARKYPVAMPQALRDAGYYTMMVGKTHWTPLGNPHGFHQMLLDEHCQHQQKPGPSLREEFRSDYEAWFWSQAPNLDPHATGLGWNDYQARPFALPEELHATRWTGDAAVRFIAGYRRPEPFFLKVSFIRPHSPYDPPERFMKMYADAELPPPRVGAWAQRFAERSGPAGDIWHGDVGAAETRRSRQGYYGSVTFVDEQVGRILNALERSGVLDDTLILHTSDHGDMLGDQHLWRKSYAYEQSARIPLAMRWPGGIQQRGQVHTEPVELRDVLPTFLDAAAAPIPASIDGRSLLDLARAKGPRWRQWIDLEHDVCYHPDNHWNALTDGHVKYIFHAHSGAEQLFDLDRDPHELHDLAADAAHAARLGVWRARMVEHLAERGDEWVKNGKLQLRMTPHTYSPNYPVSG